MPLLSKPPAPYSNLLQGVKLHLGDGVAGFEQVRLLGVSVSFYRFFLLEPAAQPRCAKHAAQQGSATDGAVRSRCVLRPAGWAAPIPNDTALLWRCLCAQGANGKGLMVKTQGGQAHAADLVMLVSDTCTELHCNCTYTSLPITLIGALNRRIVH